MNSFSLTDEEAQTTLLQVLCASIVVGIGSGFLGMSLALLLHYIQHLAYGYSPEFIISDESFLIGVSAASPERRVLVLFLCSLVAGFGWYLLYRYGKPLVSISETLKTDKKMPVTSTIVHAFLQIITIALGSPLGREVAPRELGSLFATWVSAKAKLSPKETKIMIACGAGAGLAAVYNVPLGGAVFTMEVLFVTYSWSILIPAFTTAAIATLVSWWGLGIESIYHVPNLTLSASIITWALLTSPIFGFAAYWFIRIATLQRAKALHDKKMILASVINFTFIGVLAVYFPVLLGNGKSPVQMEFTDTAGIALSALLLVLRSTIAWTSLRSGAQGGLLTPSLANGALLAAILGGLWSFFWPIHPFAGFIVIGATSFLAAAQKMPLTAIVLMFGFTHIHFDFLVPIMLSVVGSTVVCSLCRDYFDKKPRI
jgi:H+/Cl- antiporter ClcA